MNLKDYWIYLTSLKKIIFNILILFIFSNIVFAQAEQNNNPNVKSSDSVFIMTKSPWGAVLRSAIIPGWGQIYNESYWKAPIIIGITSYFIYGYINNNKLYKDNKELYNFALQTNSVLATAYKNRRDFYRDQRDLFIFYIGLTYLLNMVDAYVDAQMFDFSVSDDISTTSKVLNIKFYFK